MFSTMGASSVDNNGTINNGLLAYATDKDDVAKKTKKEKQVY